MASLMSFSFLVLLSVCLLSIFTTQAYAEKPQHTRFLWEPPIRHGHHKHHHPPPPPNVWFWKNIEESCSKSQTKFYDLCVSLLKSNSHNWNNSHDSIEKTLANIALTNITGTDAQIPHLLMNTRDHLLGGVLSSCKGDYDSAVKRIQVAISYFDDKLRTKRVVGVLDSALKHINTCGSRFTKHPRLVSPLKAMNQVSTQILTISIDVATHACTR